MERLEGRELVWAVGRMGDLLAVSGLEQSDSLHEELVEIRGENRDELQAFEQRGSLIERLCEHPAIELKPRQIPVDKVRRVRVLCWI